MQKMSKMGPASLAKCFVAFLLFAIVFIPSLQAQQSGTITGMVVDKISGDPLPGANVFLKGTSLGAATTFEGDYTIRQIPAGSYTLVVKYIGYKETVETVNVQSGKTIEVNIKLEYVGYESDELVVTAQAVGQIEAINQQLSSNTIKNVVSADRIQDIPDANAAESVSRLPGISLIRSGGEGQKVAIRGLSPKYNVTMVNGVRMQSTDRDDRSVDLNMISPNILSGIEVTKALTADMDADAVGGTINLKISKAPTGTHSKISVQQGYGSLGETYGNFKTTGLFSKRYWNDKLGVQFSISYDDYNRNSDVLSATYAINEEQVTETGLANIDLGTIEITDRVTDRKRAGAGLVLDYQFKNGSLLLSNFISNLSEDQTEMRNDIALVGKQLSGYGGVIEAHNTVVSNALQGEYKFNNIKMDFSVSNSVSMQYRPGDLYMDFSPDQGRASFSTDQDASATPSQYYSSIQPVDNVLRIKYLHSDKRAITEISQAAVFNIESSYNFGKYFSGDLKLGGKYTHTDRDNDETKNYMSPASYNPGELFTEFMKDSVWTDLGLDNTDLERGIRASLFADPNYDIGDFLSGEEGINSFYYIPSVDKMNHYEYLCRKYNSFWIHGQGSFERDFDYVRNLYAFYVATEIKMGKYVTLMPGIRYEKFNFDYTAYGTNKYGPNQEDYTTEELDSDTEDENWFPQMQVRIKPTSWLDLRLSSTKSIIYPDYRAISPFYFYNTYNSPELILGNPDLKPAISQNYDIYASVYDNLIGLFTAGYFYKEIDNLILTYRDYKTKDAAFVKDRVTLVSGSNTNVTTWVNLESDSYVRGFELDWQTHFWYLPSFLKGLVFNINYTHINSSTRYPDQQLVKEGDGPFAKTELVDTTRSGSMIDQPDDVLNATLGYDIGGFSARLSYVYQDNVITSIADRPELDPYTDAYNRWDLIVYQRLPLEGLQLFLNVNNITNEPDRRYISVLKKLSGVEYYGRTVDLGIRYSF